MKPNEENYINKHIDPPFQDNLFMKRRRAQSSFHWLNGSFSHAQPWDREIVDLAAQLTKKKPCAEHLSYGRTDK